MNVSGGGMRDSKGVPREAYSRPGRPTEQVSWGGAMGNGEFKAQGGVGAFLDNFDFDANCTIPGYKLVM